MDNYRLDNYESDAYLEAFNAGQIIYVNEAAPDIENAIGMVVEHGYCVIEVGDICFTVYMETDNGVIPEDNLYRAKSLLNNIVKIDTNLRRADEHMWKVLNHAKLRKKRAKLEALYIHNEDTCIEYRLEDGTLYLEEMR